MDFEAQDTVIQFHQDSVLIVGPCQGLDNLAVDVGLVDESRDLVQPVNLNSQFLGLHCSTAPTSASSGVANSP